MKLKVIKALFLAFLVAPQILSAGTQESFLYIQVRESTLRAEPKYWGQTLAKLPYGAKLISLGAVPADRSWLKVKLESTEGYVHLSAVTKRRIVLSSSAAPGASQVDASSVVLAGKGFNRQVEGAYASSKGLDFSSVDEVEKYRVETAAGAAFIKDGKLS